MSLHRFALMLALAVAAPAAAEPGDCWRPGKDMGVFGWRDAPSRTCRDESATSTSTPDTSTRSSATPLPATPADAPATSLTFSGEVYVGIGMRF